MKIEVNTKTRSYTIHLGRGLLQQCKDLIPNHGQVFIVSDDGVAEKWRQMLQTQFPTAKMHVFKNGEGSKNFDTLQQILAAMQDAKLARNDMVIALGGGVVGDMAGFASAIYKRGIHYVGIPTTTLSQIDSSIGGKTAIDFNGVKNSVGAFWQPSAVIVDLDTLQTLPTRHVNNGLVEAVKAGLIKDKHLFELFEQDDYFEHLEEIIYRSLLMKKEVVEHDETEMGERKLLNFGHTFGHGYEAYFGMDGYYHGECVGMGMMTILNNREIKDRLGKVLQRLNVPTTCDYDEEQVFQYIQNDKKASHDHITVVQVDEIGKGHLEEWTMDEIRRRLEK